MMEWLHRHMFVPAFESGWHRRSTFRCLRELEESQWLPAVALRSRQIDALRKLLAHAGATCPYYRTEWDRLELDPRQVQSLQDFAAWPIINRETIREHRLAMRSQLPDLRLIAKATGGSSGVPLHFDLDHASNDRKMAAWHRGYAWAGAGVGTKQFYLWGGAVGHPPRWKRWKDALYHRLYRRKVVSCFGLTDERVEWCLRELNRHRPDAIVAYTNPLYFFSRAMAERGLTPWRPRSIIVGAEKLHGFQRALIEQVFQAPVFETYGSREFMLIGGECPKHAGLHVTMENLLVEVLDDDGRPTPPGEEGNVVVTDLTNYGMPFIRYANGDRAISGFESCSCGRGLPMLRKVVGRRLDLLTTPDGRMVPGEFFPHLIKEFAAVRRFQVVQEWPDEICVKLVVDDRWCSAERSRLEHEIREMVGEAVKLELDETDDIPLTVSGKLQVVINRCPDAALTCATNPG